MISRRSKFCSGTRFIKRGIDQNANVANEVETEIFVYKIRSFSTILTKFSSYLFVSFLLFKFNSIEDQSHFFGDMLKLAIVLNLV